jgi:ATP-binding cassette subfamily C (CFTR/MRP) protein 4
VTLFDFLVIAFVVLGAVVTTLITMPFTLVAFPPLMWYFLSVRRIFVTSTRELKRLEGLARSPIFAMISESLGGIATIRANNSLDYFQKRFENAHDSHTRAFFAFIAGSRWVGFRMDGIMFLFLTTLSFLSVLFHDQGWFDVDPTILGLVLSMLLQLVGMFQWCIRQSAEVVNQMVSVERVLAFGELEPEAPLEHEEDKAFLENGWPATGSIEFQNLTVRYRQSLPPVLENVGFRIPAGSRVGIVGRTGSGV